jgi:hypothetical protein
MCTVILGQDILGPGTVLLGANRDEDPARATAEPGGLTVNPKVVGGRDMVADGTWLAIREGRIAVALLNRRPPRDLPPRTVLRSRGLLTLDVATVAENFAPTRAPDDRSRDFLSRLPEATGSKLGLAGARKIWDELGQYQFAPFSLLWASPEGSWILYWKTGGERHIERVGPGWHVVTHEDLDDINEPRTAWLSLELAKWRPETFAEALAKMSELLGAHGGDVGGRRRPRVCLHDGVMQTVSSSILLLGEGGPRYFHASGHPCETPYADLSELAR